jgi:hypothetical protein
MLGDGRRRVCLVVSPGFAARELVRALVKEHADTHVIDVVESDSTVPPAACETDDTSDTRTLVPAESYDMARELIGYAISGATEYGRARRDCGKALEFIRSQYDDRDRWREMRRLPTRRMPSKEQLLRHAPPVQQNKGRRRTRERRPARNKHG